MEGPDFLPFVALILMVMFDYATFQSTDEALRNITSEPIRKKLYQVEQGHWCQLCPAGKYLVKHCEDEGGFSICKTCPENQFLDYPNNKISCISCTDCGQTGREIVEPCTKTSDTECQCPPGKFLVFYLGGTGFCQNHKVCPPGTFKKQGTPWKDTECGKFTSTMSISQSTSRPPTTSRDDVIPTRGFSDPITSPSIPTTCPSINPVPCESHKQCCDIWFGIAMVELVIIVIFLVLVIVYFRKRKGRNNSQHYSMIDQSEVINS